MFAIESRELWKDDGEDEGREPEHDICACRREQQRDQAQLLPAGCAAGEGAPVAGRRRPYQQRTELARQNLRKSLQDEPPVVHGAADVETTELEKIRRIILKIWLPF